MKNKKVLLVVIGILLIIAVSIGMSYAYYITTVSQVGQNVIKSDCFKITYTDQDTINLNNSFPMTDADGASLTPYQFTIKNVCENTQYYEVNLETLSTSTIDESKLKVKLDNKTAYLYGSDGYASNKVISDAKNAIQLASGILTKNQEKTYSLRLYVDESVTTSTPNIQNKSYLGKVTIYAALNNRNFSIAIQRNNSTIKEDRVQGTKLDGVQYEYDLTNTDITNATNISCNEDAQAVIEDNKLKVSNMHENTICKINDTLKSTIDNLDESLTNIKMIKNEDNVETMTIASTRDVVLDLNGKEIKSIGVNETSTDWNGNHVVININGKLTINDSIGIGGMYTGNSARIIGVNTGGNLVVNGGNYSARNDIAVVGENATAIINGGTFNSKLYVILSTEGCNNCQLIVNNGTFIGPTNNYIFWMKSNTNSKIIVNGGTYNTDGVLYCNNPSNSGTIEINGGTFTSTGRTINNNSGTININGGSFESTGAETVYNTANGIININGGSFESVNNSAVYNTSTDTVNINQSDKPIYISSRNSSWSPAVYNYGSGLLNINGTSANKCTSDKNNTLSGLCIYSENNSVANYTGTIKINGGSYANINYPTLEATGSGKMFIKNVDVAANGTTNGAIGTGNSSGSLYLCNSKIDAKIYDMRTYGTGKIYYSPNVIFTDGTNTPKISSNSGTITKTDDACNW